jgi:hypothetical protein
MALTAVVPQTRAGPDGVGARCHHACMVNHLDMLVAIDEHTRESSLGCAQGATDLWKIAAEAHIASWGEEAVGRWTGELVYLGYLTHNPKSAGDRRAELPGNDVGRRRVQSVSRLSGNAGWSRRGREDTSS